MRAFKALRSSVCNNTFWIIEYNAWTLNIEQMHMQYTNVVKLMATAVV